jgi:hypothetical protein
MDDGVGLDYRWLEVNAWMEIHELHPAHKISRWIKSNIATNLNKICRTAPVCFVTEQIGCWIVGLISF